MCGAVDRLPSQRLWPLYSPLSPNFQCVGVGVFIVACHSTYKGFPQHVTSQCLTGFPKTHLSSNNDWFRYDANLTIQYISPQRLKGWHPDSFGGPWWATFTHLFSNTICLPACSGRKKGGECVITELWRGSTTVPAHHIVNLSDRAFPWHVYDLIGKKIVRHEEVLARPLIY